MNWTKTATLISLVSAIMALTHCAKKKPDSTFTVPARPTNRGLPGMGELPRGVQLSYRQVNANGPFIAMTFDDGPHATFTPRLLDILAQRNIKATFYVVGNRIRNHAGITRRIAAEGHEFGNHTWSHPFGPGKWPDAPLRSEIQRTHDVVLDVAGLSCKTYRPPGGSVSQHQKSWIFSEFGYPTILWSVDPLDWKRPGPAVVTQRILTATRPGHIVLAHDIHPGTIEAMPATLDGLLAKGFRFVTVSQLIGIEQRRTAALDNSKMFSVSFSPGSH